MNLDFQRWWFQSKDGQASFAKYESEQLSRREQLTTDHVAAVDGEGAVAEKFAPKLKAVDDAEAKAKKAFEEATVAKLRLRHEYQAAQISAAQRTSAIAHELRQLLPSEAADALARLDQRMEAIREIPDPSADDRVQLSQLITLRSDCADTLHLLPMAELETKLQEIEAAIAGRSAARLMTV